MFKVFNLLLIAVNCLLFTNANCQQSENITLLYHWDDTTMVKSWAFDNAYNETWGFVQDNREYAVIGSTDGSHFFDVTDPVNTKLVDYVPGYVQGGTVSHRDYHDYHGYLYMVCDQGWSSLQIVDLSYLPDSVHVVHDSHDLLWNAHNIYIDTAKAILYSCGERGGSGESPMALYSLVDPENPTFITTYDSTSYVHDIYVRNDTAYIHALTEGLRIVDFSDTSNPVEIASLTTYPDQGLNHSGCLSEDGNIYAFADEDYGMDIKIYDVSDMNNLSLLSTFNSGVHDSSVIHNLFIHEGFIYFSNYFEGLRIFDIADPTNPVEVGYYDTYPDSDYENKFKGAWGVYPLLPSGIVLVSDMQTGLYVFDVSKAVVSTKEIEVISESEINIYPNPVIDQVTIEINSPDIQKINSVSIYDFSGKLITNEVFGNNNGSTRKTITLDHMPAGLYTVKVNSDHYLGIKKLIKVN